MDTLGPDALKLLQIIWVNIILSGDNAVVIALACRGLPKERQRLGAILGAAVAVGLRLLFTLVLMRFLHLPFVQLAGGVLLVLIAVNLLVETKSDNNVQARSTVWGAVVTIALADAVMSLDNVLAIAGAARGNAWLTVFGLGLSVPLVVFGAGLVMKVIERFPIVSWAGAALLGWVAGGMLADDPIVAAWVDSVGDPPDIFINIGAMALVLFAGLLMRWRKAVRG